jgi:hypothetical protein
MGLPSVVGSEQGGYSVSEPSWTKDSFVEAVMYATYGDEWPEWEEEDEDE